MPVVTIKNEELTVKIKTFGAEITSIKNNSEKEFIWQGGDAWRDQALVLFPIVSRLKDGKYFLNGKEYSMEAHGFAKDNEFEVEEITETGVTMLLRSNSEIKKQYPFDFEFRVRFILEGKALRQEYITNNKSSCDMYYSTGSHEGYACPGGVDKYTLVFDEEETIERHARFDYEDGRREYKFIPCLNNERELKLSYKYFDGDQLAFFDFKSRGASLRDDRTGEKIHISFPDADTLLCWTRDSAHAEYLCIEPWCGTWDMPEHPADDFSKKYRIRTLKPGEREVITHTITF